jgi:hypothetical protein
MTSAESRASSEFGERTVDQPQLVEGMLADPLRILPDLPTRNGSHVDMFAFMGV